MKKIILLIVFIFMLGLVACNDHDAIPKGDPIAEVIEFKLEDKTVISTIKILVEISSKEALDEAIHSTAHRIYEEHKTTFGSQTYTFFLNVELNNELIGTVSYKINSSISQPGLIYVAESLNY
ncbi:hypothetical protein [Acholeplasma equifetale]|uniref:hypothetical protein n=1 Tax=Acholeplasma equifetale TaxID=264634 RepID=UPI00047D40F6|nr:hypothetical protein [Acholeplasma equifetale]